MTVERKSEHYTYRDIGTYLVCGTAELGRIAIAICGLPLPSLVGSIRYVHHFHYLSWPEVGVPSSPLVLLDFLREIQKNFATLNIKSPITVHCRSVHLIPHPPYLIPNTSLQ